MEKAWVLYIIIRQYSNEQNIEQVHADQPQTKPNIRHCIDLWLAFPVDSEQ